MRIKTLRHHNVAIINEKYILQDEILTKNRTFNFYFLNYNDDDVRIKDIIKSLPGKMRYYHPAYFDFINRKKVRSYWGIDKKALKELIQKLYSAGYKELANILAFVPTPK